MMPGSVAAVGRPTKYNVGSIRLDAGLDLLRPTTKPASPTAVTFCGWAKRIVDRNNYSAIFTLEYPAGHSTEQNEIITDSDGTTLKFYDHSGGFRFTLGTLTANTWFFIAAAIGNGTVTTYFGTETGALSKVTNVKTNITDSEEVTMGASVFHDDEFFNGEMARCRIWDAVLSEEEIYRERISEFASRQANLLGDWPLKNTTDFKNDYSGNSNSLETIGGEAVANGGGLVIGP